MASLSKGKNVWNIFVETFSNIIYYTFHLLERVWKLLVVMGEREKGSKCDDMEMETLSISTNDPKRYNVSRKIMSNAISFYLSRKNIRNYIKLATTRCIWCVEWRFISTINQFSKLRKYFTVVQCHMNNDKRDSQFNAFPRKSLINVALRQLCCSVAAWKFKILIPNRRL